MAQAANRYNLKYQNPLVFVRRLLNVLPPMGQDLAHKRPWLLASLVAGITFPATWLLLPISGNLLAIIWKMAAVGLLVPYALRRHHTGDFALLATVLGFYALGDGLLELDMIAGALAFAAGHLVAIWIYLRHRRVGMVFSQKLLALTLLLVTPVVAFFLPGDRSVGAQVAVYGVIIGAMAAAAWSSNFPRYRVGMGAVLFVVSDLLIFARMGDLAESAAVSLAIWFLYYFGVLMIAVGIVHTLVKRGHYSEGDDSSG